MKLGQQRNARNSLRALGSRAALAVAVLGLCLIGTAAHAATNQAPTKIGADGGPIVPDVWPWET